jgi:DNA (cytosine-5)-methyltransferase 1
MNSQSPPDFLLEIYNNAMQIVAKNDIIVSNLSLVEKKQLDTVLEYSEQAKAVLTVLITSLCYKSLNPKQDVRNHQVSIKDGYSGRTYDVAYITPFMKLHKFPAMSESGWLTRSLEQKVPYDKNYSGAINPKELKLVFLNILENIELGADSKSYLSYLFQGLIIKRNLQSIDLAKPTLLSLVRY